QPLIDALFSRHYSNTNSESLGTEKIKCLEYLLEKHLILLPINPNQYGIENMSPEALEYLINNMYLSPNHTDSLGRPLLYNAMSCLDLLEGLLKHGVNLNAVTAQDGCHNTPIFHYVARNCCYTSISWDTAFIKERQDILSFFIRNGVDVSSKDDIGMTAFHKIAKYDTASLSSENRGQLKNVLGSLIEAGLDLNARDRDGKTALTYVQDEPLKKWLMSFGATE
ncbi:MAG TPA: hypothetical protein VJB34_07905, partial [Bdellovibrionota bacterium]|nr:hypothetical protein [Bdellovibrionota bacterium]